MIRNLIIIKDSFTAFKKGGKEE
jgi:hypothetical protein